MPIFLQFDNERTAANTQASAGLSGSICLSCKGTSGAAVKTGLCRLVDTWLEHRAV